jgi:hypothetical protein
MKKTFKAKFEYCHVYDDKIILTKTPEIGDLVIDYGKSIHNFFKTLMVFLVATPLFTSIAVAFYYEGYLKLSIFSGLWALFFLVLAFYSILFTSGIPVLMRDSIVSVRMLSKRNAIEFRFKGFGRIKKRYLLLPENEIEKEAIKSGLYNEGLFREENQ